MQITHDETGTCILTISPTTLEDKGNYVAKATNLHGEAKAIARLVVKPITSANQSMSMLQMLKKLVPPTFEEVFADTKVGQGGFARFECIIHGKPTPKVGYPSGIRRRNCSGDFGFYSDIFLLSPLNSSLAIER